MRLFYGFIVQQLRREPLRTWATVAGIAVGVAMVIAIQLANASSVLGFRAALEAVSGRTSLEITGAGIGVDEDRLATLAWLRTFGHISPIIDGDALLRPAGGTMADAELVRVLGVDILRDRPFREYRLLDQTRPRPITTEAFLSLLTDPQAVVLTQAFADRQGLELESGVELLVGGRRVSLIVRGLLGDEGPAQVLDGNFVLMDIAAAQLALGRLGRVDRVDVQLGDDIAVAEAEQAIGARLPSGLTVQRPERRGAQVEKMLAAFHFNLAALSYIALLVGLFLVYNTVSVSVITRRAEIGMLRTVGASRRTILRLFLGEAVSLAMVGCALGAPLGWVLAQGAVRLTSSTVTMFWVATAAKVPPLDVGDVGMAFAVGVPLAVVAAIVPALEASRLSPVATVRSERELAIRARLPRRYLIASTALFLAAAWGATRPPIGGLPVFGVLAALAVVLAAALLAPPALYVLQRLRGPRGGWLHVEGALARTNLGGAIRRLAISVAALAVSLAMMVAIAIMIGSFRETVVYWVGQTLQADLFVTAARQSPVGERATISTEIEEAITGHPAFVAIDAFRGIDVTYEDSLVIVGSGRFDVMREHGDLLFKTPSDERDALARAIREAGVVVSESFSLKFDKTAGDTIELPTARGPTVFPVVGVYYDYSSDRGLVVMDEALFTRHYDDRRPSGLMVYLAETADPTAVRAEVLAALGPGRAVFINTNAMLRGQALQVFDSTFAITYALEAIAIFVSMFGVAATLLTLTLERRQQIAMLRLIGAERKHLRRMIMIEATLLGVVSLGIGLVVGLVLSLILIYVINVQSFGWTIQFHLPVLFLVRSSLLILAGTTLAGLYPARLAGRFQMGDLSAEA